MADNAEVTPKRKCPKCGWVHVIAFECGIPWNLSDDEWEWLS